MDQADAPRALGDARRWAILAVTVLVAGAASALVAGSAFLLPTLHTRLGASFPLAGTIVAMSGIGTACTLVAWGWVVDRTGERRVLALGAALAALATAGAALAPSLTWLAVFLLLAGAASASASAASGRVVVGWFPAERRGLAMGIRQMSQPLGAAVAAMTIPVLARDHGVGVALTVPLVLMAAGALAAWLVVTDPPRPPRATAAPELTGSPYRHGYLWRIHGVSVLLVVPQALMQTYLLVWLVLGHGWDAGSAGAVVTASQLAGAAGRIAVGVLSDRVGSRMRPLRWVSAAGVAGFAALAAAEAMDAPAAIAIGLALAATVVSVADNGLAFTAVAEYAGPFWSGRALGAQNTVQFLTTSAMAPVLAWTIDHGGYWPAFAAAAALAALALPLVPRADRSRM